MMKSKLVAGTLSGLTAFFLGTVGSAIAADLAPKPVPVIPSFFDTVKFSGYVEAGITGNADDPGSKRNFGQLFTDHANIPLLNQASVTVQRALDPKATGIDFGFKIQAMYGSDARYIHSLGLLDRTTNDRYQPDIIEAWGITHLPYLTSGGIDVKFGKFVTPLGYEVIDPTGNLFYTHGYIFNFGLPLNNVGILTTTHVTPNFDLYAGVDTGVNTTFIQGYGDENKTGAFQTGVGFNFLDGNLTILALTHVGPENPRNNKAIRYFNDVTTVYKYNDKLTFALDLNYVHDDINGGVSAYGAAGYASYAFNDIVKINGRAEVFRDADGFFVGQFPLNNDFTRFELGNPQRPPSNLITGGGRTTYSEFTLGLNITPPIPKSTIPIASVTLRPEVRYDRSLSGSTPFDARRAGGPGTSKDQFTFGGDIIVAF